jgi:hypothetical protein
VGKKYVRVIGHSREMEFPFGEIGPWRDFAEEIELGGFTIAKSSHELNVDFLIAHSHSNRAILEANQNQIRLKNRILVIWEPEVVDEKIRNPKVLRHYGHIFVPSESWNVNANLKRFKWPQSVSNFIEVDFSSWLKRENTAAMIQANKQSIHKNEKYSLRRKVIASLVEYGQIVALYGNDWNKGLVFNLRSWLNSARHVNLRNWRIRTFDTQINDYPGYRGATGDKLTANAQHRCSIVIENSLDYVSEKLFDAILSGTYVIYVGPNLSDFGLGNFSMESIHPYPDEIARAVNNFLELDPFKQFELMKAQRKSLEVHFEDYNNSQVLRSLAKDCLAKFNEV